MNHNNSFIMQFSDLESQSGLRLSSTSYNNRNDQQKMIAPCGCLYTPFKSIPELVRVAYEPVFCKGSGCSGILNPFCQVDFSNHMWVCTLCRMVNSLPPQYAEISQQVRVHCLSSRQCRIIILCCSLFRIFLQSWFIQPSNIFLRNHLLFLAPCSSLCLIQHILNFLK